MSTKRAELLAPAGGMDALKAAVAAGCDAVYIGGRRFGARANAGNFSDGELAEAVDYCHLRGVRVYVTVNTLYYDDELPGVLRFIEFAYTNGADAFIFQDIGAAMEAKRRFNGITLHASTQMTAQGPEGVEYLREKGFSRVVLPRELSLDDIRAVCRQTDAELEVFVHGALCVGYSGQCLLSSMIGGRSGNRGSCAQPCRKRYRLLAGDRELADGYLICPKDLMTLERLSEVISAGADSIKIEGRMKSPEYVYQCVASYRAALDGDIRTEADLAAHKRAMAQVFNRGGFTEGYMWNHSGGGMMSVNSPKPIGTPLGKVTRYDGNAGVCEFSLEADVVAGDGVEIWASSGSHCGAYIQAAASAGGGARVEVRGGIAPGDSVYRSFDKALMDILKREAARDNKKLLVRGRFLAVLGKPAELELSYNGIIARQSGGLCEPAKSQPMTAADIERQLSKTGGTSFEISFEDSHAETGIFINKAELNALRRAAVSELEEGIRAGRRRVAGYAPALPERIREYVAAPLLTALTRNREQFDAVIDTGGLARVYMECTDDLLNNPGYYASRGRARGVEVFAALPQIWDDGEDHIIAALENSPLAGWLARSFGSLAALGKSAKPKVADYTFNVTNTLAYDFFAAQAGTVCFSPEAGVAAISAAADKRAEIIAHGRQNMMTTRQCPVGIFAANKGSGKFCRLRDGAGTYALEDERGVKFPVLTDCGRCVAHIFNDRPVCMLHRIKELDKTRAGFYRISLSTEGAGEAAAIVRAYAAAMKGQDSPEARALDAEMEQTGFTYGYFFKEPQKNKKR